MGKKNSFRSKAAHFVSDVTTVLLNPISDKPSKPPSPTVKEDENGPRKSQLEPVDEEDSEDLGDGPDTSSFPAFLYSLWSTSDANSDEKNDSQAEMGGSPSDPVIKESGKKKSLFSRGKQSLRTLYQAARISGYRNQERKTDSDSDVEPDEKSDDNLDGLEMRDISKMKESTPLADLPDISEPSLLISEKTRGVLYASLPVLVQGRKWLLLYSTWRHGISLSTLYRRSMLWPGLSLLVVGDRRGAVFGGLVEAPLRPTNKRKYQGSNSTFVFTNTSGQPVIFRPTVSETYGNPCLANSEDFEVKEIELWGFVYGSRYEEILALSKTEMPGICRW
ncbi:hypothetical protein HS088_TW13G00880 [Tripterygium wilfordii]|uniref:Oxidation resistance protein 1 n=1 Tax=Tripterygium wilfordii TaxID=458696 RepID=A0A7J7CV59_TRIWF|nr:hypothetical protein HS088_TW13G00880 [Tripterygium wilfordii]